MGGWGSMVNFIDDIKLRGVPLLTSLCPISIHLTLKRSNLVLSRARIKATAKFLLHIKVQSSPVFSKLKFSMCFQLQSIALLWCSDSLLGPACGVHMAMGHSAA